MDMAQSAAFFGPFALYPATRELKRAGTPVRIGARAFDLLAALVEAEGAILSPTGLLARAWAGLTVDPGNLRANIAALRRALAHDGDDGDYIRNVVGRVYCFTAPVRWTRSAADGRDADWQADALPAAVDPLFGRDADAAALSRLIVDHALTTITGPGGIGKTTLAAMTARVLANGDADRIPFVDLSEGYENMAQRQALADALLEADEVAADGPAFLILDNCEHLIDFAADLCSALMQRFPALRLIATSREPLRVAGEQLHVLRPLATPAAGQPESAAELRRFPSIQLFAARAAAAGLPGPFGDRDIVLMAQLCRIAGGLPLAIELIAGRAGTHGLACLCTLAGDDPSIAIRRRDGPARHRSLKAVFDWSFDLLETADRSALQLLARAGQSFSADEIARTFGPGWSRADIAGALSRLIDKSLLVPTGDRFTLQATTRLFAMQHDAMPSAFRSAVR